MDGDDQVLNTESLDRPTFATYVVFRRRLADVVTRICQSFTRLEQVDQYPPVQRLQKDLQELISSLPPHYRMQNPDTSLDGGECFPRFISNQYSSSAELHYLSAHRFYLQTELLHWVIILNASYLIRYTKSI